VGLAWKLGINAIGDCYELRTFSGTAPRRSYGLLSRYVITVGDYYKRLLAVTGRD
jgi:hypothetical protein